jgi:hypothetical protein
VALWVTACLWPGLVRAEAPPPSSEQKALAEVLFRKAREALKERDFTTACPTFEESYRLDAALGTRLNLAVCHEQQGKLASAWVEFTDAASEARRLGQKEREQLALRRAQALKPLIPTLLFAIPAPVLALDGLTLLLDGKPLARALWTSPLPVDAGSHVLEVRASNHVPYKTQVEAKASTPLQVDIPMLDVEASANMPAPLDIDSALLRERTAPPVDARTSSWKRIGIMTAVVGGSGIAAGAVFGLAAMSEKATRDEHCFGPGHSSCDGEGLYADQQARRYATGSTIAFLAGSALTTLGIAAILAAPAPASATESKLTRPSFGLGPTGFVVGGRFP